LRNRANEGSQRLGSRRRAGQTGAALPSGAQTCDLMHSQRQGALKTQRIKSSFSRDPKNCLTRYVRNYSIRSACGPFGKPIREEALRIILAGSAMRVKLRDDSRPRNASSACIDHAYKNSGGFTIPCWYRSTYDIMAPKTGPHAVSTILPIA